MSKSKLNEVHTDKIPSYEEATAIGTPSGQSEKQGEANSPLHTSAVRARARRVQALLSDYIEPVITSQAIDGNSTSTLILIPSNRHPEKTFTESTFIGSSCSNIARISIIRLQGHGNQSQLLLQPLVIRDLRTAIRQHLATLGHNSEPLPNKPAPRPSSQTVTPSPTSPSRRSWFRQKLSSSESDPTKSTSHWKSGWRTETEDQKLSKLAQDETRVTVKHKDASFRSENEMGLLCTDTVPAIWIDIEVGNEAGYDDEA
ncbi:MAG: hypothetical protein Q9227_009594 [Pyrenula ochraceoflavens]